MRLIIVDIPTTTLSTSQLNFCFVCLVCVSLSLFLISRTLDWRCKQMKNKSTNKRKSSVSLNGKLLEPRWRFFLFSFAIFVGSICIFQKSTKENSPGAEMADLHIEDSTEGEEWETERERETERKPLFKWFQDEVKETIMSISWQYHAYYAGLIAVFTTTKTVVKQFHKREEER